MPCLTLGPGPHLKARNSGCHRAVVEHDQDDAHDNDNDEDGCGEAQILPQPVGVEIAHDAPCLEPDKQEGHHVQHENQ